MRAIGTLMYSLISAVLAAVAIQYFVGGWNEEYLSYTISEPVQVSKGAWQQTVELGNSGVDPALNVKVFVRPLKGGEVPSIRAEFDLAGVDGRYVGCFERIRRKESVAITATASSPISSSQLQIKSDRSIAEFRENAPWSLWPWSWWPGVGTFFLVYVFLAIAIPARRDYLEAARMAKEAADRERRENDV